VVDVHSFFSPPCPLAEAALGKIGRRGIPFLFNLFLKRSWTEFLFEDETRASPPEDIAGRKEQKRAAEDMVFLFVQSKK